ncbi:MAG TPA: hypothetical protein VM577_14720, partial [Anaerovoracaceae bacterium]|nr:hypothetical protein [Anaerovoracaceae bacterium]
KVVKKAIEEGAEASPMEEVGADMLVSSSHLSHLVLPTMEMIAALGKKPASAKMKTEVKMTSTVK